MEADYEIVHAIPGRVRMRVPRMRNDPALADILATRIANRPGVTEVRANTACASLIVDYDVRVLSALAPARLFRGLASAPRDRPARVSRSRSTRARGWLWAAVRAIAALAVPTAALGFSLAGAAIPTAALYASVAAASAPVFYRAFEKIRRERRPGVDLLDATAIAVLAGQRKLSTCALMAWLIGAGEHIRNETALKTRKAVAELLSFDERPVVAIRGQRRVKVRAHSLRPGDRLAVQPGDVIPADGTIVRGSASVNEASLTGESTHLDRTVGDPVYAGTISLDGELLIEATSTGPDTRIGSIVTLLSEAAVEDSRAEDYAAKLADGLVLPTFALSGAVYAARRDLSRALSVLIVDFGTGVRVAAPTVFLSYMAQAAQRGVVFKSGRAIEKLAAVDTIVFDKTGTLTHAIPCVHSVIATARGWTPERVLRYAAGAECGLNHPFANALVTRARETGLRIPARGGSTLRPGLGITAEVRGKHVAVGSERFIRGLGGAGVLIDEAMALCPDNGSRACVAVDGELVGVVVCGDTVRPEGRGVISELQSLGVKQIALVTGDRAAPALAISRTLGVTDCIFDAFPEQKMEAIRDLKSRGRAVAVVGDGVNDCLALTYADVAVAPYSATDAAKEAADVLLMHDDLRLLVEALTISRSAMALVRQNLGLVAVPNALAILLAAAGLLGPAGATVINNGATVAAGLNSLRPMLRRPSLGDGAPVSA